MKVQVSNFKTIFKFSFRILFRQWKSFVLPFLSLSFTTLIVLTVLLFTNSSSIFLQEKNKELVGGDISIESNYQLKEDQLAQVLGDDIKVSKSSVQYNFSGIITKDKKNTPVSLTVVDSSFPVYGGLSVRNGTFVTPSSNEIYIDTNAEKKLNVKVGESILYANTPYVVAGVIEKDSKSLMSGFNFLPKVYVSIDGFAKANIDMSLLRSRYTYVYKIEDISTNKLRQVASRSKSLGVEVQIAGVTKSGLVEGLSLVEQFLVLAILLSCVLSAVNIYAGMLYLLSVMKKSFAVLLAIGFNKKKLAATLSLCLLYILILSTIVGGLFSVFIFNSILKFVTNNFGLTLPFVDLFLPAIFTMLVVFSISFASFLPSLKKLISLNPKILLSGGDENKEKNPLTNFIIITLSTLIPLGLVAIFLLDSFAYGLLSILAILIIYVVLAVMFYYIILLLYKNRNKFKFLTRTLISYKYKDGLFGVVSLTSLYVALTSLSLLILLQSNLGNFIKADLGERLPSVYVIDIQKSQTEKIKKDFDDVTLFPNVGARILSIDNLDIQKGIALGDGSVSREFGREYNLTYRNTLLPNEKVVKGDWLTGKTNEVSVEEEFADRANIKLGSTVVFSVSGFEVTSIVTSIRKSDSRSGLPFFFFVFNPIDLEKYPATFFGYTYLDNSEKENFTNFLATNFPNVSTIDTNEIRLLATSIIDGLLIIIFVISLPPLILALFLIATLIISSFAGRRKQSAQLLALGAKKTFIERLYYLETVSTTLFGGVLGYITAIFGTLFITKYYLRIKNFVFFDIELIIALGLILLFVLILASVLWRTDKKPLRELLSYEEH